MGAAMSGVRLARPHAACLVKEGSRPSFDTAKGCPKQARDLLPGLWGGRSSCAVFTRMTDIE